MFDSLRLVLGFRVQGSGFRVQVYKGLLDAQVLEEP